jgi:hypothetical protein
MVLALIRSGELRPPLILEGPSPLDSKQRASRLRCALRAFSRDHTLGTARGARPRQGGPRFWRLEDRGFGTLGGSLALLAALSGIGLAKLMFKIREKTTQQIALDRCTGEHVIRLRAAVLTMEESYSRLNTYRIGVLGVCAATVGVACPEAIKVFNKIADLERQIQISVDLYWSKQKLSWQFSHSRQCATQYPIKSEFPDFPFSIIEEGPLSLIDLRDSRFAISSMSSIQLRLATATLASQAELKREEKKNAWSVRWVE